MEFKLKVMARLRLPVVALCTAILGSACSNSNDNPQTAASSSTYSADIVWTEYGIPHVTADDWGSLGFGVGNAFAQLNFCSYMRDVVRANGQSAQYLGDDGDLEFDFVMKLYNTDEAIERAKASMSERGRALFEGYAAGISRYLADTGVENLAQGEEGCRGEPWVREITFEDVLKSGHKTILRASADPFHNELVAAVPPDQLAMFTPPEKEDVAAIVAQLNTLTPQQVSDRLGFAPVEVLGSNAYGIGRDASGVNSGVLYGNPHFPWQGVNRFFMAHQTIPGEYDVMGAGLFGVPLANIGFNKDVAWSHTVSTARRFSLHELEMNPENPLEYLYDGEFVELQPLTVSAIDGSGATVEHTFYISQFGPIADLGGVSSLLAGWPTFNGTIFAFNDANKENLRGLEAWINFGQAENIDDVLDAMKTIGIPWVNTIAADRAGEALYSDISVVPHATTEKINNCVRGIIGPILLGNGVVSLDGSDSSCQLGNDEGAPPNVLGFDNLPKLRTNEYGANANDSYWLPNPRNLLTGFSRAIGPEEYQQTLRTRLTFVQAEQRLANTDGLEGSGFTNKHARDILNSARNHAAELINDDVVSICKAVEDWSDYGGDDAVMGEACDILDAWDTRHTVDSVGGHVFYEFWRKIGGLNTLWAVPFDATDPVNTPNTLNTADMAVVEAVKQALVDGVEVLQDNGIALNLPWGQVQFIERNGERIGLPGGSGSMLFSVISASMVEGEGYSDVRAGNSYIHAVSWDSTDCPDANAILTYSQSTDPASPHFADATKLYSQSGWIDMPFCEADRDAQEIRRETVVQ
jgi:acyl-homoserine-lactone acylase